MERRRRPLRLPDRGEEVFQRERLFQQEAARERQDGKNRERRHHQEARLVKLMMLPVGFLGVFAWALHGGQFDDLEQHGETILEASTDSFDPHQTTRRSPVEK